MAWFKVDDAFWSHPKVIITDVAATGAWLRAASWSSQHLTDGRIPHPMLCRILPARETLIKHWAEELCDVGLWLKEGDTWVFHDWADYQPASAAVRAKREQDAERKRLGRATQRHLRTVIE